LMAHIVDEDEERLYKMQGADLVKADYYNNILKKILDRMQELREAVPHMDRYARCAAEMERDKLKTECSRVLRQSAGAAVGKSAHHPEVIELLEIARNASDPRQRLWAREKLACDWGWSDV
jgi:hypothetical protein